MRVRYPELERRLNQEAVALNAKQQALSLVSALSLSETSSSEFVEAVGLIAASDQTRIDATCEPLVALATSLGWKIYGTTPNIPGDSNTIGEIVFDSDKYDPTYIEHLADKSRRSRAFGLLKTILGESPDKLVKDARVSQIAGFVGKVLDLSTGFDTPQLVMGHGPLGAAEFRHLTQGSVIKLKSLGETHAKIAELAGYSRPQIAIFENEALESIEQNVSRPEAKKVLTGELTSNERVRIRFRPRS